MSRHGGNISTCEKLVTSVNGEASSHHRAAKHALQSPDRALAWLVIGVAACTEQGVEVTTSLVVGPAHKRSSNSKPCTDYCQQSRGQCEGERGAEVHRGLLLGTKSNAEKKFQSNFWYFNAVQRCKKNVTELQI